MRHVGPARVEMGVRTIFNILGPLANPASVKRLLIGTFAREWVEPMAQVLGNLGTERAWVVHGADGLDELTITGPSYVAELADGKVTTRELFPSDAGLPTVFTGRYQRRHADRKRSSHQGFAQRSKRRLPRYCVIRCIRGFAYRRQGRIFNRWCGRRRRRDR